MLKELLEIREKSKLSGGNNKVLDSMIRYAQLFKTLS